MPARRFVAALLCFGSVASGAMPTFKTQEIDTSLQIGYGVVLVDVNGDAKTDIVVADKERVIWFENPSWKLRTITQGTTKPDNVCIAPHDIDGDGKIDFALGAGFKFGNTKDPSTLQWLRRGKTLDEPWEMFPIPYDEPILHRMRWADLNRDGKKVLVTVPLVGRGATAKQNWSESAVRIQTLRPPADPTKPDWPTGTINEGFHVAHNFDVNGADLLIVSYEGVSLLERDKKFAATRIGEGDQSNPSGNRGASEVRRGRLATGDTYVATIEPWHGNQVVIYANGKRHIVDDQLRWGHAVWCADLDGDKTDEIIVGVRDALPGKAQSGVRIYRSSGTGDAWEKSEIDPGGVAVEDLAVADLNGDGKPDIVAVGRQTKNARIYWNH